MVISNFLKRTMASITLGTKRFPETFIFSTLLTALLIINNEIRIRYSLDLEPLKKLSMVFTAGMFLFLCIRVLQERIGRKNYYLLGYLFLILYYFLIRDFKMETMFKFISLNLALFLAFLYIPYFKRDCFEVYVEKVVISFFTALFYSGVLYFGISAILFAIDRLLEIKVREDIYFYFALVVFLIFGVFYFLSNIPKDVYKKDFSKTIKVLLLYIIMPLLLSYTVVLYIFFAKILLTLSFPRGLISHLVLWYCLITIFVLFFITPFYHENKWATFFFKFIPKLIIPIILVMFVSIALRINQYGLTERRYYVLILGIWIFLIMIYFSFLKKENIIVPITLSVFILISNFGPLSSFNLSKYSQNKRFEAILIKNGMLKGKIIPNSNISYEDKRTICGIIDYFELNHSLKDLKYIPKDFKRSDMKKVFGFDNVEFYPLQYFTFERNPKDRLIDVKGYDYLLDMRYSDSTQGIYARFDFDSSVLRIFKDGKLIYSTNLNKFAQGLMERYKDKSNEVIYLPKEEMCFLDENQYVRIKIEFNLINIEKDMKGKGFEFYILIKEK
ncbi:protein of unknown function [Caloramator fervidus]|uniref:DUF4153 domain-containing protein n=1 Tax=Caloramator fervidus TaxID=29344 RepID=A0A1H5WVZ1_9CLOT|nr:DUF4153 domain-containing protein [Caloramator fervidus]SEG03759.1 protein of unknown function [Caloramator fervidus]